MIKEQKQIIKTTEHFKDFGLTLQEVANNIKKASKVLESNKRKCNCWLNVGSCYCEK